MQNQYAKGQAADAAGLEYCVFLGCCSKCSRNALEVRAHSHSKCLPTQTIFRTRSACPFTIYVLLDVHVRLLGGVSCSSSDGISMTA